MLRADRFFESNPVTRLERWIDFSRAWGVDEAESDKYEMDARRLVTVWGPGHCHDGLNDYSCRMWSGLIRDYYLPRWKHFFEAKKQGVPFDTTYFFTIFLLFSRTSKSSSTSFRRNFFKFFIRNFMFIKNWNFLKHKLTNCF